MERFFYSIHFRYGHDGHEMDSKTKIFSEVHVNRVRTLLSSSNSMTFHDFFHDFFEFFKTLRLAVSFTCFRAFFDLKQFNRQTQSFNKNACRLRCLITPLYLTLSLPC